MQDLWTGLLLLIPLSLGTTLSIVCGVKAYRLYKAEDRNSEDMVVISTVTGIAATISFIVMTCFLPGGIEAARGNLPEHNCKEYIEAEILDLNKRLNIINRKN